MLGNLFIPLDVTSYSAVTVVPKKVAHGFVITREMIEDSLIPVQQDQLVRSSLRIANKIDKDCISAIGSGASGSVAATGKSMALDGTEFVLSGSGGPGVGIYDLSNAKSYVEVNNYKPDTLLCNPLTKTYIEKLPHFTAQFSYGQPKMQEGWLASPGKFGEILGMDAYASTNCPSTTAYVLSRGRTTNILGQYMGFKKKIKPNCKPNGFLRRETSSKLQKKIFARSLTSVKPLEERDSMGIYITTRYGVTVLRGETVTAITGIASPA